MSEFETPNHIQRIIAAQDHLQNLLRRPSKIQKVVKIDNRVEIPADELPVVIEEIAAGTTTIHNEEGGRKKQVDVSLVQIPGKGVVAIEGKQGQKLSRRNLKQIAPPQVLNDIDNATRRERREIQKKHQPPKK